MNNKKKKKTKKKQKMNKLFRCTLQSNGYVEYHCQCGVWDCKKSRH